MATINAKTKARIRKYSGIWNEGKDGTTREVDFELGRTRSESVATFGQQLTDAVFAGFVTDKNDDGSWKLKNPKPSKLVVCQQHQVKIDGEGFVVQPRIRGFRTVEDTPKIVAVIRMHLGVAQVALRKKLEDRVGEEVNIEIEPSNMELPLGQTSNLSDRQLEIIKGGTAPEATVS